MPIEHKRIDEGIAKRAWTEVSRKPGRVVVKGKERTVFKNLTPRSRAAIGRLLERAGSGASFEGLIKSVEQWAWRTLVSAGILKKGQKNLIVQLPGGAHGTVQALVKGQPFSGRVVRGSDSGPPSLHSRIPS